MNPIDVAQEIFFTDNARMLMVVHAKGEANWSMVCKALYNKSKNFDMFKALAAAEDLICQTNATKNAKTAKGLPKFLVNSLSDGAMYKCTELGNHVVDELSVCKSILAFVDGMKRWKDESHSGMSFYEFMMNCDIKGKNPFDPQFIEDNIIPELDTTLGSKIKASFVRRMKKFFDSFPNTGQTLDNVYSLIGVEAKKEKKPVNPLNIKHKMAKILHYGDQWSFKRFIKKNYGFNADFEFEAWDGIDNNSDSKIPGLTCNGTITWQEAFYILKQYYNVA